MPALHRRRRVNAWAIAAALLLGLALGAPGLCDPAVPVEEIAIGVLPPGALSVSIAPLTAEFQAVPGAPSTFETPPFDMHGESPLRSWSVVLEMSALRHVTQGHLIPPDRVRLVPIQGDAATAKAAWANQPAAQPIAVLAGGLGTDVGPVGRALFKLQVDLEWTDPAGDYVGTLRFSQFATP